MRYCKECGIQLSRDRYGNLCDCCWTILESLASPYWRLLHREMVEENHRLLRGDNAPD